MKCEECDINYPEGLVQPFSSSEGNKIVCGICALHLSNKVHGVIRTRFDGKQAEILRMKAAKFRSEHPEVKPRA